MTISDEAVAAKIDERMAFANTAEGETISAMLGEHSIAGRMRSGITIIRLGVIGGEVLKEAVKDCLAAISQATAVPGKRRSRLIAMLRSRTVEEMAAAEARAVETMERLGLGGDVKLLPWGEQRALIERQFDDYETGWTAPKELRWYERHPLAKDVLIAVTSVLFGWLLAQFGK